MRNKLIFGSTAMKHWFQIKREPKDLDYICKEPLMDKNTQHYWVPSFQYILDNNKDDTYVDLDFLYTIKLSHAGFDIHWDKTIYDILILKFRGCKLNKKLYKDLVKDWTEVHGKCWASLKGKDSETFFEDAVPRKYIHDDIHEAIAVYDKPLYESLLFEGVSCSKKGFDNLTFDDKILLVKEEVWVTALERYHIPSDFTCGHRAAYEKSLKKLATTMSSGWFKLFILENIDKLIGCVKKDYIEKFKKAEQQNKLKLWTK